MKNTEIVKIFNEIADLLEIKDENPFKIRAYRKAAMNIESLTEDIEELIKKGTVTEVPGIGKDLAQKIKEYLETGYMKDYERLKTEVPRGLVTLLKVPGIGPKTAKQLYEGLKIDSIEKLEEMAKAHRLQSVPGIRVKTEENILRGIELFRKGRERRPLGLVLPLVEEMVKALKSMPEVKRISPAGSIRRRKDTIRDIDILITSITPEKVIDFFTNLPVVEEVMAKGTTKATIITKDGIQADLRVVEPECYGAALAYFTGSKAHNIRLRDMASRMGLKISEYGIFKEKTDQRISGRDEEDIYKVLGIPFIPPEIREDAGEIEAALEGRLPRLVEPSDIKGDFHVHSKWSDGGHTILEMAEAAKKKGYEYIAITDHSKSLGVARGLSEEEVLKQIEEIEGINKKLKGFRILCGTEVDIRGDGTLDFSKKVLSRLDIVVASIHSGFRQDKKSITGRIIKAMRTGLVTIIAHPTGRLLGERDPYEVDLDEVFKAARETGTALEINSYPQRLDLNDIQCKRAKEIGVMLAIGTDAHTISQLGSINLGVSMARRGWLEKENLLNTLSLSTILKKLKK